MKKMKIGLDVHGVILTKPKLFAKLSRRFVDAGHEVHIITGASFTTGLQEKLTNFGICWTHIFSIVDNAKETGIKVTYDKNGDPWTDKKTWDEAKAKYCKDNEIDLHIDDSEIYGLHFETPYMRFVG